MDKQSCKVIRREYRFIGDVQNVGFRYRAKYAANGCGVTGFVRNEWDGSVVMEAQGTEVQIHNVLKMINTGMYIHIDRMVWKELPLVEEECGFHVR